MIDTKIAPTPDNLRAEKARWKLTFQEIGALSSIHPRLVNMYFAETRPMSNETRLRLARAMNDAIMKSGEGTLFDESYVPPM